MHEIILFFWNEQIGKDLWLHPKLHTAALQTVRTAIHITQLLQLAQSAAVCSGTLKIIPFKTNKQSNKTPHPQILGSAH